MKRRLEDGGGGRVDAARIIKSIHLNITRLSRDFSQDPVREAISENQKHAWCDEQLAIKGKNNGMTATQWTPTRTKTNRLIGPKKKKNKP